MYSRVQQTITFLLIWVFVFCLGCTEKLETGTLKKDFPGVETVEILSPTAVRIFWKIHNRYQDYTVYSSRKSDPEITTNLGEATITGLSPDTSYTFKVIATNTSSTVGGGREINIKTPKKFTGATSAVKDADGNIVVSWSYDQNVEQYQIFYKEYEDPTATNTNSWATPNATSTENKILFRNLTGSTRFHFIVHVKYLDGTYERTTSVVTATSNSSFPNPVFELSSISIGSLPFAKVDPVVNANFLNEKYTSRMYLNNSPISDPLIGRGIISFSSNLNFPLGEVSDLVLKVNYNDGIINETRIFDSLKTYIKGVAPYLETPPVSGLSEGLSMMGESLTTGDFNCDGAPDLAVGLPKASIASLGVKNERAGAVFIYYSAKESDDRYRLQLTPAPKLNPANPGKDPQIITFEDLPYNASLGKSLSGQGNLNGDFNLGKACQDLIIGAPSMGTEDPGLYDGAAFVIFGSPAGLKAPSRVKDLQQNVETCNGLLDGATCSAVMLWPDMRLMPSSLFKYSNYIKERPDNAESFGHSVSFIGDFNADGYDDIAVGAPGAMWDGPANPLLSGASRWAYDVGFVAIYYGSRFGLGYENIGSNSLRFIKIFPPYPTPGQKFGWSVSGGVDVDGRYRTSSTGSAPFYGGPDLVIGSPGFGYPDWNSSYKFYSGAIAGCWSGNTKSADNCPVASGHHSSEDGGWGSNTTGTGAYWSSPRNSSTTMGAAVGAAFVYFGIGSTSATTAISSTQREQFYQCGRRGATADPVAGYTHWSCFASNQTGVFGGKMGYRILYPRSEYKNQKNVLFGSSVILAGNSSRYDANNNPIATATDPNGDSFGEIIVTSGQFSDTTNSKYETGALWTFYGNTDRLYEHKAFFGLDNGAMSRSDVDWRDGSSACSAFASDSTADKLACAPTLIKSNSIANSTRIGYHPEALQAADITGDGLKDIIVGGTGDSTKGTNAGAVFAFTSLVGQGVTTNFFNYYNANGKAYDYFGRSLAVGDFDGDITNGKTFNDIAVGAYLDKSTKLGGGAVYGFLSNGQPLSSMITIPSFNLQDVAASLQTYGLDNIQIVGDINGDGYEDAVTRLSRPSSSSEYYVNDAVVYFGSKIGLVTTKFCLENLNRVYKTGNESTANCYPSATPAQGVTQNDIALPQFIARPNSVSERWAYRVFAAGDVNGDGFADVAFHDYNSGGQIVIYFGSRGGLQAINNPVWVPASGDPQIVTKTASVFVAGSDSDYLDEMNAWERKNLAFGDFNGDFKTDLVIADPNASSFFTMNKSTSGPTSGLLPKTGDAITANSGWQCGTFAVGDPPPAECTGGIPALEMGRVFIVYGSESGLQTPRIRGYTNVDLNVNFANSATHLNYLVDIYGSASSSTLEACNATTQSCKAQYLYSPMIENVMYGYERMKHWFGASVTAFDMNGDGIDELAVGAPGWEDLSCYYDSAPSSDPVTNRARTNYGRVFIYKGTNKGLIGQARTSYYNDLFSAGACNANDPGISSDPGLNVSGSGVTSAIMPPILDPTLAAYNSTARNFGHSLSSADFNGDGLKDLVVGAPLETPVNGNWAQGTFYVYYGPICGADNNTDIWDFYANDNYNIQKFYTNLGVAITSDCGASKTLAPIANKIKDGQVSEYSGLTNLTGSRKIYTNDPAEITQKYSDFNGDGYDDLVIGGSGWDDDVNGNFDHGRGTVFFGSTFGLFTNDFPNSSVVVGEIQDPNGTTHSNVKPYSIPYTDSEPSPQYYRNKSSAGDVNGDGTVDIMITSPFHDGYSPLKGIDIGTFFIYY